VSLIDTAAMPQIGPGADLSADISADLSADHAADPGPEWAEEVRELARRRDAVLLAHNYQLPAIQDVADHVGDSLGLSRIAAASDAGTIVFCGVHFMAETAKILAPDKAVLIPDAAAGCSLADSITADQLRAWKAEHPDAVVVSYVNTTAEVKAETDICCTSSNAVEVVESVPADREVLFLPDQFLGAHVRRVTGRDDIHVWAGECHVHAGINGATLTARAAEDPDAELFVTPSAAAPPRRSTWPAPGRCRRTACGSSPPAACSTPPAPRRRRRCWSPPRSGCCTSSAGPLRRSISGRSTTGRPATT
jgi:quinolinate synthase